MNDDQSGVSILAIMLIVLLCMFVLVVLIAIEVFVCWLLYSCFKRIPKEFRLREPGMVWLLLIPFFNLVWIFFIYPTLATSYKKYFDSIGRADVGDCGYGVGLAYCICACCSIIPYLGILPGLAALVLMIIFLVKAWDLRSKIPPEAAPSPAVLPPAGAPNLPTGV